MDKHIGKEEVTCNIHMEMVSYYTCTVFVFPGQRVKDMLEEEERFFIAIVNKGTKVINKSMLQSIDLLEKTYE